MSITAGRSASPLVLPTASVSTACTRLAPCVVGISAVPTMKDHLPSAPTVPVLTVVPQVTRTVVPASPVPDRVTPAAASAPLTMPSPAIASMVGAAGVFESTAMVESEGGLALPAASRETTDTA